MDLSDATWRKSARSQPAGNECVEIAALIDTVAIRDSKNPDGPSHVLGPTEWRGFLAAIKSGRHDTLR
jgi:hypothetical protein